MTQYAKTTKVPASQSRSEIEKVLNKYGASGFMYAWQGQRAVLAFTMEGRAVRLSVPMPDRSSSNITYTKSGDQRSDTDIQKAYDQATRQVWRAVLLIVKGKLEAIETGIVSFDEEFMPHIVMPDGRTMSETVLPAMQRSLEEDSAPPMLPDYSKGDNQ